MALKTEINHMAKNGQSIKDSLKMPKMLNVDKIHNVAKVPKFLKIAKIAKLLGSETFEVVKVLKGANEYKSAKVLKL